MILRIIIQQIYMHLLINNSSNNNNNNNNNKRSTLITWLILFEWFGKAKNQSDYLRYNIKIICADKKKLNQCQRTDLLGSPVNLILSIIDVLLKTFMELVISLVPDCYHPLCQRVGLLKCTSIQLEKPLHCIDCPSLLTNFNVSFRNVATLKINRPNILGAPSLL